ncbi:MAG: RICIN domain-containing protein [Coriobacteriales bacterium]|jgi:GH25 family lysozyme M1 (1,4-beta-N-acetylmuramidase)|nr:RICIN domain-containing protein [Coriobacteriales bacterium]
MKMSMKNGICIALVLVLSMGLVPLAFAAEEEGYSGPSQVSLAGEGDTSEGTDPEVRKASENRAAPDEGVLGEGLVEGSSDEVASEGPAKDASEAGEGDLPPTVQSLSAPRIGAGATLATLAASADGGVSFDVTSGSYDDGAVLQIYRNNMTPAQRFRFQSQDDGYYTITNVQSGKVLGLASEQPAVGAAIQQYSSTGAGSQRWLVEDNADGSITLRSKLDTNYVIDITSGSTASGTKLQLYPSNGTAAQRFMLGSIAQTVPNGLYTISSGVGQTVMDVESGSLLAGGNIRMWNSNGTFAQKFRLSYDPLSGYYTITAAGSSKVLDVQGGVMARGTNVQQYHANNTNAQKWTIVETTPGSGAYTVQVAGGYVLDVQGGSSASGANIWIYPFNGTPAQQFSFTPAELIQSGIYTIESGGKAPQVVDVAGASAAAGASLQVWTANDTLAQKFRLNLINGDIFTLESLLTGYLITDSGSTVSMEPDASLAAQQWYVMPSPLGGISFINVATGRALDLAGGSGPALQSWTNNGTAAQQFRLNSVGTLISEGQYSFFSFANLGQALDITSGSTADDALLQCYPSNGTNAQKFWVNSTGDGYVQLLATHSFKALEVQNGVLGPNGQIVQRSRDSSTTSQKWTFEYVGSGCFRIVSALASGAYVLTLKNASAASYSGLATAARNAAATQMFRPVLLQKSSGLLVNGLDVSSWQPSTIGWNVDYDFLIVKATGGNYYRNPNLTMQADAALARGKKLGLYHYAHESGTNDAVQEADWFVANIGVYLGRAVLFLDFEESRSDTYNDRAWVAAFCNRVKERTGISCQIYTAASWATNRIPNLWNELDVWLWEASWPAGYPAFNGYSPTNASHYSVKDGMRIHQYTSNGHLPGYGAALDFDVFYGTRDEWTYRETH